MIRKIIRIDKDKCNGCGACASACHEGAIDIINGKAELVREHFCDGLGDCLPECPTGAISFEEREAPEYDEKALVKDTVEIVVQINGKIKEKINIAGDSSKEEMEKIAVENDNIKALTEGKNIVKIIAVPNKLINIVVK